MNLFNRIFRCSSFICCLLTICRFLSSDNKNKKSLNSKEMRPWWGMVDSDHRSQWQQIYSLPPLAARERSLELVIGVEPTTCWLQISCSAIEPHQRIIRCVPRGNIGIITQRFLFVKSFFWYFYSLSLSTDWEKLLKKNCWIWQWLADTYF